MESRLRSLLIIGLLTVLGIWYYSSKKENHRPPRAVPERPLPAEAQRAPAQIVQVRSGPLVADVSTHSGAIRGYRIETPQFGTSHRMVPASSWWRRDEQPGISTTNREPYYPLRMNVEFRRAGINVLPAYLTFDEVRPTDGGVTLVSHLPEQQLEIHRTIKPHTQYAFTVATRVINHGASGELRASQGVYHWVERKNEDGQMFSQSWRRAEGLCHRQGRLQHVTRDEMSKLGVDSDGVARNAEWVAVSNMYFVQALIPQGEQAACHLRADDLGTGDALGSVLVAQLSWTPVQLGTGESHDYRVVSYMGPKTSPQLAAADPTLKDALDLGTFAVIARGLLKLLQTLQSFVKNWGIAIMLLTLIVRTALFPLLAKSMKSMAGMQKLKPEIDAVNAKYPDDANARGLAMMEVYRRNGISPTAQLTGCLPMLAQMPVWWALYSTLQTSVELYHAPLGLWIVDLSAPDPFFVLPLILGVVMFLQQKLMPAVSQDPTQAKIMLWFMPIFLTVISLFLPAGLALYMLVNSALAIVQQKITKAQMDKLTAVQIKGDDDQGTGIQVRPAAATAGPKGKNAPRKK